MNTIPPSKQQEAISSLTKNALDLNSSEFDAEHYVQDLLQKKRLEELVAVEQDMVNNVRRLDSEMQSLVYENYSKFLNATSTVRDMQTRLADTHNEMRDLSARVQRITNLSDYLTEKFSKNCDKVKKLNDAKKSIKRLEFLIKAPQILQNYIEQGQLTKAVDAYLAISSKLEKFQDISSIAGISKDVKQIIEEIKEQFYETLNGRLLSSEEVIEAVNMLKKLDIPEQELEKQLLTNWEKEMTNELEQLKANAKLLENGRFPDIFEFVDVGCCHFLTNMSLMASTFLQLFPKQYSKMELVHLLEKLMEHFELILGERFELERNPADCALFVKALDRIYRKISVLTRLASSFNFTKMNSAFVQRFAKHQIKVCRQFTLEIIDKAMEEVISRLNHSPPAQSSSKSDSGQMTTTINFSSNILHDRKELVKKMLEKLENGFVHSIKSSLAALLMFTASDIIFPTIPHFSSLIGFDVHEQIVVGSMKDLVGQIQKRVGINKSEEEEGGGKGIEILVLCTFLRNLQLKHLDYLMELCREQYRLSEFTFANPNKLTEGNELAEEMKREVEMLLRKYVQVQSGTIIQMTKKSIDLFEWATASESPRKVRNLIRHLVHSIEEIDADLSVFMDDGGLAKTKEYKQKTPDSLHSYPAIRRAASAASSISLSSGGIVERLWADSDLMEENNIGESGGMETVTIPLEFRRDMIVNAIVRLMLKAMCDFVRNQTFSAEGLEQMQVDCAFMRQKLWATVGDEHMLNTLIEDVLTVAVNQCAHPKLLDPSVLRSICEEN